MADKEKPFCPTCGQKIVNRNTTESDFCEWIRSVMEGQLIYHSGTGRSRGHWARPGDDKPMSALDAAIGIIHPRLEGMTEEISNKGFERHWRNFGNAQGIYRMMSVLAVRLRG